MRTGSLVLLTMGLALACAGSAAPGPESQGQVSMQPKRGGYLRHLSPYSPANLDPHTTEDATGYGFIVRQWYEPLISIDFKPGVDWRIETPIVPFLAQSWKQDDAMTYTFTLHKGIRFHNGDELTSADVAYSYGRFLDPNEKTSPSVKRDLESLGSVQALDDHTVRLTSKRPDADFLFNLARPLATIVSKKFVESGGDLTKQAVGSGPFKLTSYRKDVEGVLVRNEQYWQKDRPYLDGVKMTLRVEDSAMIAAFASGKSDTQTLQDKQQFLPVQAVNPRMQVSKDVVNQIYSVLFNLTHKPFDDVRVRRAIFLALDRQELDTLLTWGEGTISGPLIPSVKTGFGLSQEGLLKLPGFRQPKDLDLAEAKRLLAEAGYPNGFKTTLAFGGTTQFQPSAAQAVNTQLKRLLNIEAELAPLEQGVLTQRRTRGELDMSIEAGGTIDRLSLYAWGDYHSSGTFAKAAGMKDAELDRLIEQQAETFDRKKRGEIFIQIQRLMMERAYAAALPQPALYTMWQPWIHDYVSNLGGRQTVMNPWAIWMDVDQAPEDRRGP